MQLALVLLPLSALLVGLGSACTFYTACPTDPPPPATSGGSSGTGGTAGTGGANGTAGTTPDVSIGGEAPTGEWQNETFNLVDLESECGNVSYLSAKPNEDALIVSVAQHGLLSKAADATEWVPIGQGEGSAVITNRGSSISYDPENANVFWESGIYNEGGVYRTDDGGQTFIDLGLRHNDYVSIDFTDPDRQTLLASGHEVGDLLYYSGDGGMTWDDIGANFPEDEHICSWPVVLDSSTFLLGCGTYAGGRGGIYRSTDAGESWQDMAQHRIRLGPLRASDGAIYFAGEATDGMLRSDDQGETWQGPLGAGELTEATAVELPDGRIAAVGQRRIVVSSNQGEHWRVVSTPLDFQPLGLAYSVAGRRFYVWYFDCDATVPDDAVMSYAFDYEQE